MSKSKRRRPNEGCEMDMTPMIDVTFQLIIFFVVTIKFTENANPDIVLEDGKHGEIITAENQSKQTFTIEVSHKGRISINNATCTMARLEELVRYRYSRYGSFPVMIRADYRTPHDYVRRVMDVCTRNGVWRVGFLAVQERKVKNAPRPK